MTALVAAGALSAPQGLSGLPRPAESADLSERTMQTQESAFAPQGSGKPHPLRQPVGVRHPGCDGHWMGTRTAHCARCHITTSGLRAFEAHQRITGGILQCLPPDKAGLVAAERPWGVVWSQPASESTPWSNPAEGENRS